MGLWIVDHTKSEQIKGLRKVLQALPAAKLHIVRAFNVIRDLTRPKDSMLSNNSSYKVHQLGASPQGWTQIFNSWYVQTLDTQ